MKVTGPEKLLYLTLGIMFLALGIVGLIVPILPGVLFLGGALYMLSRGSNRIREYAEGHPHIGKFQRRMQRLDGVGMLQRAQVAALVTLQTIVVSGQKLFSGIKRLVA